ncbi:Rha family transcriptional regulator [Agrobacterium rosae]|uniref:Rha family transcriptional regulator n=1 Tax=Agrobacterium rosae TaxID=1972867 RepID=UPI003BA1D4DD
MSSREIAKLTGKRHHTVMRDATNMLVELHGLEVAIKFEGYYIATNGKRNPELLLPKRETLILVSGYSVELRTRINHRGIMQETIVRQERLIKMRTVFSVSSMSWLECIYIGISY